MSGMVQQTFGPLPLQRVENGAAPDVHKVENGDLPLELAKALTGSIVAAVLHATDTPLKEYGDKSQVGRWKRGEENPNFAKLIQRADARKVMAKALLKSCDDLELIEEWRVVEKAR